MYIWVTAMKITIIYSKRFARYRIDRKIYSKIWICQKKREKITTLPVASHSGWTEQKKHSKSTVDRQSTEWVPIHQHVGAVAFQFSCQVFILHKKQLNASNMVRRLAIYHFLLDYCVSFDRFGLVLGVILIRR